MGISGLLKGLQCYTQKGHIREFSGQALAVDASSWLHKSVYSVAERYVETTEAGVIDSSCIKTATNYIVSRCQELLVYANIGRIYLVTDGLRCPLKAETSLEREIRRQQNLQDARRYYKEGLRNKAEEKYKTCIKIRTNFAQVVVQAVEQRLMNQNKNSQKRVIIVGAPYEADSQLVKLCWDGLAQAIVTEDSDVLLYSATCRFSVPILFKLDRDSGSCDVLTMDWLLGSRSTFLVSNHNDNASTLRKTSTLETILKGLAYREQRRPGAGVRQFIQACVLAGCDYAPSCLTGIGLVTAFKLVRDQAHRVPGECFRHVLTSLPKPAYSSNVNRNDYEALLSKSEAVFYYHPVVDTKGRVVHLLPPIESKQEKGLNEFMPSMTRFQDWSFLGTIQNNRPQDPSRLQGNNRVEAPENCILPKERVFEPNKLPKETQYRTVNSAGVKRIAAAVTLPLFNPYRAKRPRNAVDDAAATPSSMNGINNSSTQSNPFAEFSLEKENLQPSQRPPADLEVACPGVHSINQQSPKSQHDDTCNAQVTFHAPHNSEFHPVPFGSGKRQMQEISANSPSSITEHDKESLQILRGIQATVKADNAKHPLLEAPERIKVPNTRTTSKFFASIPRRVTLDNLPFPQSPSKSPSPHRGTTEPIIIEDQYEPLEQFETFDYGSPSWHSTSTQTLAFRKRIPVGLEETSSMESPATQGLRVSPQLTFQIAENTLKENGNKRNVSSTEKRKLSASATSNIRSNGLGIKRTANVLASKTKSLLFRHGNTVTTRKSVASRGMLKSVAKGRSKLLSSRKRLKSNNHIQSTLHNHFPMAIQHRTA